MFIEKRKFGKDIKYYLVYSYREKDKVNKFRRYLGKNLSKQEIELSRNEAEKEISSLLDDLRIDIFNFVLTKNQIQKFNEIESKIKIDHLQIDWTKFTEEFVYNTNAIEGSTVSLDEVKEIIEHKKKPKDEEELEAKNVAKAVNYIMETKENLSLELIKKLHKICFTGTKSFAGKLRDVEVVVRTSRGDIVHSGVPFRELDDHLNDLIEWYKGNKDKFRPLVLAAIIHNQFEHIHPFQDGNGRVGRLLLNFILIKNKYPPMNIALEDRREYYSTLTEYSKNQNLKPTIEYLIKQYKKTLSEVTTKKKKM